MDRGLAQQRLTAAASSRENAWLSSIPHLPHPISNPHLGGSSGSLSLVFGASKNHSQGASPQTLVLQLSCPWALASLGKLLSASVRCHGGRRGPSKELPSGARPGSKQTAQKGGRKGKLVPV